MNAFLQRLKERKLVQWTVAYVAAAFALLQGVDIVAQRFAWPDAIERSLIIAACIGFFLALVLAWYHGERGAQRLTGTELVIIALLLSLGGLFLWQFAGSSHKLEVAASPAAEHSTAPAFIPEKSIAVLPFDNFSEDKENAYFADGIQDEVLTDLSKIADLKVIARSSVMQYTAANSRDLRAIGRTLEVAYVVEGSVRRAANKVRVTAQLIDAHTDVQKWADQYDGDLSDIFAIQSQIARQIADALGSKLSPAEKAGIAERPTEDLEAYKFYTEANAIFVWDDIQNAAKSITHKIELLEEAIQRDPRFALAYCALAKAECDFEEAAGGGPHLSLARKAAETAYQLRPDLGETHRALAVCALQANDFVYAQEEITIALRSLPNDAEAFRIAGLVDENQNHWEDAIAKLRKAFSLDPKNEEVGYYLGSVYRQTRLYQDWEQLLKKRTPRNEQEAYWIQLGLAEVKLLSGDAAAAQSLIDKVPPDFNPTSEVALYRYRIALWQRGYAAAERVIMATPKDFDSNLFEGTPPQSWENGLIARLQGDEPKAQTIFAAAREQIETNAGAEPKDASYFHSLAIIDAGLGRKEEAIREAQQAVALQPVAKNPADGPYHVIGLAMVYAWTGEPEQAIEQLRVAANIPAGATYGDLLLNPCWDSLRADPRFKQVVAALVPKR